MPRVERLCRGVRGHDSDLWGSWPESGDQDISADTPLSEASGAMLKRSDENRYPGLVSHDG